DSVDGLRQVIRSFGELQQNYLLTGIIFVFLVFVATTLFKIIKNSINEIWNIRSLPERNLLRMLRSRAISVAVILLGGILFFALQLIDAGRHMLSKYLLDSLPATSPYLGDFAGIVVVMLLSALWFYVLFLYLPNGRPARKIAVGGAVITAILFTAGKLILRALLSPGRVNSF